VSATGYQTTGWILGRAIGNPLVLQGVEKEETLRAMLMRHWLMVLALAFVASACDTSTNPATTLAKPTPTPIETIGKDSVAAAFDRPPAYPGYSWNRGGHPVPHEVDTEAGPAHCGWQSATFLDLGWPSGSPWNARDGRQYIRDPDRVVLTQPGSAAFHANLKLHATLPNDARDLGYRYNALKLYLSPSDESDIYVVGPDAVERWPRSDPMTLCA